MAPCSILSTPHLFILAVILAFACGVSSARAATTSVNPHAFELGRDGIGLTIVVPDLDFTYWGDGFVLRAVGGGISLDATRFSEPEAFEHFMLTQTAEGTIEVELAVEPGFSESGEAKPTSTRNYACRDFAAFLAGHAGDVDEFVRPALASIGREILLDCGEFIRMRDDPDWTPTETVRTVCECCIGLCDNDDFHARRLGAAGIQMLGDEAAAYLARRSRRGLSIQQNIAIDVILSRYPYP